MISFEQDVAHAVDVLGDMLTNSKYEAFNVEREKSTIWQELLSTNDDDYETLMEQVYFNVWRDHKMGLPILGEIENIYKITREMIVDYHQRMYFGENMVICASGCVNHQQICDLAEQYFGRLQKNSN